MVSSYHRDNAAPSNPIRFLQWRLCCWSYTCRPSLGGAPGCVWWLVEWRLAVCASTSTPTSAFISGYTTATTASSYPWNWILLQLTSKQKTNLKLQKTSLCVIYLQFNTQNPLHQVCVGHHIISFHQLHWGSCTGKQDVGKSEPKLWRWSNQSCSNFGG